MRPEPAPIDTARRLREVIARLIRRFRTGSAAPDGLPWSHMAVLEILDREGELTAAEIAAVQNVRPQTAGPVLHALEAADLVERNPDSTDRRKRPVTLTAAGREALLDARAGREHWLARAIAEQLDPDERRTLSAAIELLERVERSTHA